MSDHAKLSPSKRSRWALCPGSIREEAKYPDTGSGPAAADGTHSHTLLEHCIKAQLACRTQWIMVGVKTFKTMRVSSWLTLTVLHGSRQPSNTFVSGP